MLVPIVQLRAVMVPMEASVNFVLWLAHDGPAVKSAVEEAEINPLIVKAEGQGVIAVDGLIAFGREA